MVSEILQRFDINPSKSAVWRQRIADLRSILQADYTDRIAAFHHAGSLPLAELEQSARCVFPDFNRKPLRFDDTLARVSNGGEVNVRMTLYGRRGHPLRGFYHRQGDHRPLIWLNVGHIPAAVAATLGHEVGHFLWDDLHSPAKSSTRPFFNTELAGHLADPRELFADAFATIAAYPHAQARHLFSRRGWPRSLPALRVREQATISEVHSYLHDHYGTDLGPEGGLSSSRRLRYVTSMIHFSKVRAAILQTVGL